ncbi:MAG: sensor histidine kinase [Methylibium sp.]|uniref:sensor histidine kinase n=1 Tax=Methylibium sp. TaxID=2067992 RepID=UPI0017F628E3|nr:sensor histidine kinase [Methylibium sp.]MBA3596578.1 sensor histidine kinase [Methylibium sp.]
MDRLDPLHEGLAALAQHLADRRETILRAWRTAVRGDPALKTGAALPLSQLHDHIPGLLDSFEQALRARPGEERAASRADQVEDAAAHGLHRWHQGYDLREVTCELGRLHLCLVDELAGFERARPELPREVVFAARRRLAELFNDGVSESTAEYFALQQVEATGHVKDLERALEQVRDLELQRGELWRQAAHDLRGNLGVVSNATTVLRRGDLESPLRDKFLRLLTRNVSSLHALLDDVLDFARLQAGQEHRQVQPFDAAALLRELCEDHQPLATERGLALNGDGPQPWVVEGDAVKVRRVAQNLMLNALKYTVTGGVSVRWGESAADDGRRWVLTIEDTGPGFHAGPGAPLAGAMEQATAEAKLLDDDADGDRHGSAQDAGRELARDDRPVHQQAGEGVGLSIVKRLCELLDATIELETTPTAGTTFRVLFPRRYEN